MDENSKKKLHRGEKGNIRYAPSWARIRLRSALCLLYGSVGVGRARPFLWSNYAKAAEVKTRARSLACPQSANCR